MTSLVASKDLGVSKIDIEKDAVSVSENTEDEFYYSHPFMKRLLSWGVEARGMCHLDMCIFYSHHAG